MTKLELYIHPKEFAWKPKNIGAISEDIINHRALVSPQELASHISKGKTVVLSSLKEGTSRSNVNVVKQQALMLDFDNGYKEDGKEHKFTDERYIQLEDILQHPFIKEHAAFVYTSLRHNDYWNKFRVVFILDKPLHHYKEVEAAYRWLLKAFPTADQSIKDAARLFFGSKQAPYVIDYNNTLTIDPSVLKGVDTTPTKVVKPTKAEIILPTFEGEKPNWVLMKQQNIGELQERFKDHQESFTSPKAAIDYIKSIDMHQILGVKGDPFLDIFHEESNPSASIFLHQDGKAFLYHCFSDSEEGWTGDIIRVTRRLLGCGLREASNFLIEILNITIVETDEMKAIREEIDMYTDILRNKGLLKAQYKNVNAKFWRDIDMFASVLENFSKNVYEDNEKGPRCLTWIGTRSLSTILYGTPSKYTNVSKNLNVMVLLGMLDKLDTEEVPSDIMETLKRHQNQNGFAKRTNVFEINLQNDDFMERLEEFAGELKRKGWTKSSLNYEGTTLNFGKETADKVFTQEKNRTISKSRQKQYDKVRDLALTAINKDGFVRVNDLLNQLKRAFKRQALSKEVLANCIGELIDGYGLERKQLNKELREELGIKTNERCIVLVQG
jgi:hypothetical protein